MDTKRLVIGTVVGAVMFNVLGFLIFQVALGGFYEANMGSATGLLREVPVVWAMVASGFAHAALLTMVLGWAGATSAGDGFKTGAIFGFLLWLGVDLLYFGMTNMQNLTVTIVDPVVSAVFGGLVATTIVVVLGKVGGGVAAPAAAG